jgi:ferredoxin-thioredoxin reductase catalytic subunit
MVQTKMGRYWEQKKRWFFRKMWPFKTESGREEEVSKMRAPCQSHTDERLAKGECCQTKKSSR